MADDLTLNAGSGGATLATDEDAGSRHYQIVKLADGTANSTTVISSGGGVESGALRVTVASDSTGVLSVDDGGGALTVDGTVAATQSGTWNITNVSGTVSLPTGASTAAKQPALGTAGTASADVISVQGIASMTALVVDGSAVTQPVSGTITANLSATDNTALDAVVTATQATQAAVEGTLTVSAHAVTNAGTFAVQVNGDALTALQLIDNIVQVEDAVHGTGDSGVMALAVRNDTLAALAGTDGDYAPLQVGASGALFIQEGSALDVSAATVTVDGSGVTQPVSNAGLTELAAAINTSRLDVTLPTTPTANLATVAGAVTGTEMQVDVVAALPAGTNAIGDVGIATRTAGGVSVYYDNDLDETAVVVNASPGQIYFIHAINLHTAPLYLQLFNVAQGSVTVGTTAPTMQFVIPSQGDANGAGFTLQVPMGIAFGTAITAAASTNSEGNGAPGANLCHVNIGYS